MKLGKTAISHFASQGLVTLAGFASSWLIAVILGAEGLGKYSIIVSLGFFWLAVPANAISAAVNKRVSEGNSPGEYIGGGVILTLSICIVIITLVLIIGQILANFTSDNSELITVLIDYNVEIAILLAATVTYRFAMASLQGQRKVATTGWLSAVERVGRTLLQIGALLFGLGIAGISFGHATALAMVAAIAFKLSSERAAVPSLAQLRSLIEYAKFAWAGALRSRVFGWLDTIFLSAFVSASLVGIYEAAWGIASMLAIASNSVRKTLFPEMSYLDSNQDHEQIRHYLDEALAFGGIFIIPGLAGAAILGERVLQFYRPEFGQGSTILIILISAYVADICASQFNSAINALNYPDRAFRVNAVFIILNVALNLVLISWIGWHGAAIATAVSSCVRAVVGYVVLRQIIGIISIPYEDIGRQILAAAIMMTIMYPITRNLASDRLITIVIVGSGAILYTITLLIIAPRVRTKAKGILRTIT